MLQQQHSPGLVIGRRFGEQTDLTLEDGSVICVTPLDVTGKGLVKLHIAAPQSVRIARHDMRRRGPGSLEPLAPVVPVAIASERLPAA